MVWLDQQVARSPGAKSLGKCKELRLLGNKEFQKKNYESSIQFYTKSLQYAPHDAEDLALAAGNRSASLFYTEKYKVRKYNIIQSYYVLCFLECLIPLTNVEL